MQTDKLDRITHDPNIMSGRACIRGMRVTVSLVLDLVAEGASTEEIVTSYPYLEPEDVQQSLKYAADLTDKHIPRFPQDEDWVTKKLNEVYAEGDSSLHPDLAAMQWDALPKEDWS